MVKPGGIGRPSTEVISARFAPLPPSRSFRLMGGLRCLWSKAKTYGMTASYAGRMRRMAELETSRLRLRPFTETDLPALTKIYAEPEVWHYPLRRGFTAAE